jgi:hypothetical protein
MGREGKIYIKKISWKSEKKEPNGRPSHIWEDDTKYILNKCNVSVLTEFKMLHMRFSAGSYGFHKVHGTS